MAPKDKMDSTEVRDSAQVGSKGAWAEGLSKGVFAFKKRNRDESASRTAKGRSPKKQKKGRKQKRSISFCADEEEKRNFYLRECLRSKYDVWNEERVSLHNRIWNNVQEKLDNIQKEIYSDVFTSIVNFVKDSQKVPHSTIPTAVLLTGVNMPDHCKVFGLLMDKLKETTSHISCLKSSNNFKQMVTKLVMDFTNVEDDDEEEEIQLSTIKRSEASFPVLSEWYGNQYSREQMPPLVIVVQDFENCSGSVLADLITMCNRYLPTLPVVLIFGVATTMDAVHRALPQSCTAKLTINTFGSPNSSLHLEEVIETILIDPEVPFKFSAKVYQFLLENFLFHDFGIQHFMQGYRFILGEHFYRTPAAILACPLEEALAMLKNMSLEEMSYICRLPSFRECIEDLPVEEAAKILVDENTCREKIRVLLEEYHIHLNVFTVVVKCLHILTRDLPRRPLGRLMRDVHLMALQGDLDTTPEYREAFQFLKLSNRSDLQTKLTSMLCLLQEAGSAAESFLELVTSTLDKLVELEGEESSKGAGGSVDSPLPGICSINSGPNSGMSTPLGSKGNTPTSGSLVGSPMGGNKSGKLDRFKLQASLLEAVQKNNILASNLRPFDRIRAELMVGLHDQLRKLLIPPTKTPLHEIFFFSATGAVRRHLVGAPRAALHTALTDPYLYLEHADLKVSDAGEIPASLPDICVGYKLHLECPRLINVFDWLTCWHSILTGGQSQITKEEQARFTRIVSELQHLGFLRNSTRKTDHVARLTFGGS